MRILLAVAALAFAVAAQAQTAQLSCTAGPYRLKLPKSYKALRSIGTLRRERVQGAGIGMEERELRFNGLEILVLNPAGKPNEYVVQEAIISTPNWRIAGPLRVGADARTALKGLKPQEVPRDGELEFHGEKDSIRVTIARGRVLDIEYTCSAS